MTMSHGIHSVDGKEESNRQEQSVILTKKRAKREKKQRVDLFKYYCSLKLLTRI